MNIREFTLEVSLKPFLRRSASSLAVVAETIFTQWRAAAVEAEAIGILLWIGDGSEILDYTGDPAATFDWARYVGIMNRERTEEDHKHDPRSRSAFIGRPFEEESGPTDYRFLKELIRTLKETGERVCRKPVRVGVPFDPGPEFTVSDFKYNRHRELLQGGYPDSRNDVVSCYAKLYADRHAYAGFPAGIPEGTSFGTFLGRQFCRFAADMDIDFVWFSNGFGFGNFPWNYQGVLFDGETFHPELAEQVRGEMLEFWRSFKAECELPVRVRGTNLSAGRDLACDGVPLREIYEGGYLAAPPVNAPWTALNKDYGSEMAGFLSHIAGFPTMDFTFRFYVHDPWFITRPWADGYESDPWDIHMAMAAARIDGAGRVHNPSRISILTIDDCAGELPEQAVLEVTPELRRAIRNAPDAPAPLVWLYPFDEYSDLLRDKPERIGELLAGDHFIREAINLGLPLNTVMSTRDISGLPEGRVIVTPVPAADSEWEQRIFAVLETGGNVLFYGPLDHASEQFRRLLGLSLGVPLEGDFSLDGKTVRHVACYSGGGIRETGGHTPLYQLCRDGENRTLAAQAAGAVWLRTSSAVCNAFSVRNEYMGISSPGEPYFSPAGLMISLLEKSGWRLRCIREYKEEFLPFNALAMHRNGFFFSGYNRSATVTHLWRTPFGAPLPAGCDLVLQEGFSRFHFPASWLLECRVFQESGGDGIVTCHRENRTVRGLDNMLLVRGLRKAKLNLFLPPGAERTLELQLPEPDCFDNAANAPVAGFEPVEIPGYRFLRTTEEITGTLRICY